MLVYHSFTNKNIKTTNKYNPINLYYQRDWIIHSKLSRIKENADIELWFSTKSIYKLKQKKAKLFSLSKGFIS